MHIRTVFIAPKAELRCSHLCRKKDGAPFPYVKLFFLVWQMALFLILRRCFYLHVLHGLRENKVFVKDFDMREQSDKFCVFVV